ncbi:MAG: YceD family protein [Pseudomonadota bacterium]
MSSGLQVDLNIRRLCAGKAELSGTLKLVHFKRLAEFISAGNGNLVDVRLDFRADVYPKGLGVNGLIRGMLPLECLRCGETLEFQLDSAFRFAFIENEHEEEGVTQDRDAIILPENGMMKSIDLLEDELILQIPMSPRHKEGETCNAREWLEADPANETHAHAEKENPFAVLKNLN